MPAVAEVGGAGSFPWIGIAMDIVPLLISLVSGAAGGNAAGALMKNFSLGTLGNSVAGIVGGGLGGWVLSLLGIAPAAAGGGGIDLANVIGNLASGGVGGGVLMTILGVVKGMMAKK